MFSFYSSTAGWGGKTEAWNWPLSRQDDNPSSWTILDCMGLNATFRVFPTLQDSSSLSREGIPWRKQEFGDWPKPEVRYLGGDAHLCQLFADHPPWNDIPGTSMPTSSSPKVSSGKRKQSLGFLRKLALWRVIGKSYWICFLSPTTQKLGAEKRDIIAKHMSGAAPEILELLFHLVLTVSPWPKLYYCPHQIEEETEAQRLRPS